MLGPDSSLRAAQIANVLTTHGHECTWAGQTFQGLLEKEPLDDRLGGFNRGGGGLRGILYADRADPAFASGFPKEGQTITTLGYTIRVTRPDSNPGSYLLEITGTLSP